MNCSNCQNPIQEGEKFCGSCGSPRGVNLVESVAQSVVSQEAPKKSKILRTIANISIFSNILAVFVLLFNLYVDFVYYSFALSMPEASGGYGLVISVIWPVVFVFLMFMARIKFKAEKYAIALVLSQLANVQMYIFIKKLVWGFVLMLLFM